MTISATDNKSERPPWHSYPAFAKAAIFLYHQKYSTRGSLFYCQVATEGRASFCNSNNLHVILASDCISNSLSDCPVSVNCNLDGHASPIGVVLLRTSHEPYFAEFIIPRGKLFMKENIDGWLMATVEEVVASSMSINSRLPAQLEKALERNIVLRIGWTTNGDPVPKDGEMGLCPNLPPGSKVRSLGNLGPFTGRLWTGWFVYSSRRC